MSTSDRFPHIFNFIYSPNHKKNCTKKGNETFTFLEEIKLNKKVWEDRSQVDMTKNSNLSLEFLSRIYIKRYVEMKTRLNSYVPRVLDKDTILQFQIHLIY